MTARAAYLLLAALALAACEAAPTGKTGGTVLAAGDTKMRVTPGETATGLSGGPMQMLHVSRADGKTTKPADEAAARAAYAAYCAERGGVGAGGEGYFSQFGGSPAWKFGACGA